MGFSLLLPLLTPQVNFSTFSQTPFPISLTSLDISYSNTTAEDIKLLSYLTNLTDLHVNGIGKCNETAVSELCNTLPRLSTVEYLWVDDLMLTYPQHASIKHSVLSPVKSFFSLCVIFKACIPMLLEMIDSEDIYEQFQGVVGIRRLLSVPK